MLGNVFPAWTTKVRDLLPIVLGGGALFVVTVVTFGFSADTINKGYQPEQPVAYSHALHAGELGIDCRYCHNTIEAGPKAAIPPTSTCMNCHTRIWADSEKLEVVRHSAETGVGIEWARVHDLPDYVFFNHSAHVTRGVSCVECHGRVYQMEKVTQVESLSMGFCLDCHRNPAPRLRPVEEVTNLNWSLSALPESEQTALINHFQSLVDTKQINPPVTSCSGCHR